MGTDPMKEEKGKWRGGGFNEERRGRYVPSQEPSLSHKTPELGMENLPLDWWSGVSKRLLRQYRLPL